MKRFSAENPDEITDDFVNKPTQKDKSSWLVSVILVIFVLVLGLLLVLKLTVWRGESSDAKKPAPTKSSSSLQISEQTKNDVTGAIEQKKPEELNKHLAPNVTVVNISTGVTKTVSAQDVAGLIIVIQTAQNPWNWNVSPDLLAQWQQGPYGQYITPGSLVGQSADGQVIIINFDSNGQIISIIIIPNADLLNPIATPSSTPTSGSGQNASPTATPALTPSQEPNTD